MGKPRQHGVTRQNNNGGWYHKGDAYPHFKKVEVVDAFFELWAETFPDRPSYNKIATMTKVTQPTVKKYVEEFESRGRLIDPMELRAKRHRINEETTILTREEETFLLSLRVIDATRPTMSYVNELRKKFSTVISTSYVNQWWLERFNFKAKFKKASMIPKDKFTSANWFRYFEYRMTVEHIGDNLRFNFIDEKHVVNHNGVKTKARADPLTGNVEGIMVDGNFRDSRSLVATISINPKKRSNCYYAMTKGTINAEYFMDFIKTMVYDGFLLPREVLVMDNAAVHHGKESKNLENFLWNVVIDGIQLQVLVLYLPTRAPELNPIELVFHILVRRIKSFHYRNLVSINNGVEDRICSVLEGLDREVLMKCYEHCGYTCR